MNRILLVILLCLLQICTIVTAKEIPMDLSGRWQCVLDEQNQARTAVDWNSPGVASVTLPGSTDTWGLGQPDKPGIINRLSRKHRYEGVIWLRRTVVLLQKTSEQLYQLSMERTHWKAEAWIDNTYLGDGDSLSCPNRFMIPESVVGGEHTLTLRIDNRMIVQIGDWSHAVTDETQTNWNGAIGRIEINRLPKLCINRVSGNLTAAAETFMLNVEGCNTMDSEQQVELHISGRMVDSNEIILTIPTGFWKQQIPVTTSRRFKLWDEFSPNSCLIDIKLTTGETSNTTTWNVLNRRFEAKGHQLLLNGRVIKLRGTLDCAIWPLTGYPPMDKQSWKTYLNKLRRYGVNHVRFHSWCPPDAAFQAADSLGLILQIELPLWANYGHVGEDPVRADFIKREAARILCEYGQHPSFCLLSMGNELGDGKEEFLDELMNTCRLIDPDKLYTRQSGFGIDGRSDDYMVNAGLPTGAIRGGLSGSTMSDFNKQIEGISKPVISHEIGQYSMYADFSEIPKYTGVLRADNLVAFKESARKNGVLKQSREFLESSGKFALLLYKDEYEQALRTSNLAGFQSLGLQDFPGQGSTMVGLFNALMENKKVITPARHREFFSATVPLIRLPKRIYRTGEQLVVDVELSHYGASDINSELLWNCGEASGRFSAAHYATGELSPVGQIDVKLPDYASAKQLELTVEDSLGRFRNSWSIWVIPKMPHELAAPEGITVTQNVREAMEAALSGQRALLCLPENMVNSDIPGGFFPVFWNMRLFSQQAGTMGMLVQHKHPALRLFPTKEHSDWLWEDLNLKSRPMDITGLPRELKPIIQVIDDFGRNTRLADLIEARLGKGRIIICSMDITSDLTARPAAALLRQSILAYMVTDKFEPKIEITADQMKSLTNLDQVSRYVQPGDLDKSLIWVKAGQKAPMTQSIPWSAEYDQPMLKTQGTGYTWSEAHLWRDNIGASWHGTDMKLKVEVPAGTKGVLWLHLHDWNAQSRKCHLFMEGRDSGSFSRQTGSGIWVSLPFTEQDSADKQLEVWVRSEMGPNAQVTQFAVIPE
ncbi:MAG: glycoside hydrolase family 2 protein [Armatimonadota bacterium]